jgi:hypothetical protein
MEASLALRSVERSVDEVLLPALAEVRQRHGLGSTTWAVAHRWSVDWLNRAQRLAPPAETGRGVLIADATGAGMSSAGPSIRALELFCRRDGLGVLALPVEALGGLEDALAAIGPVCIVVAGGQSSDEQVGRWLYSVRRITGALPIAVYLRPMRAGGPNLSGQVLSGALIEAHSQLMGVVADCLRAKRAAFGDEANSFAQSH